MNRLKFLLAAFVVAVLTLGIYSCAKDEKSSNLDPNSNVEIRSSKLETISNYKLENPLLVEINNVIFGSKTIDSTIIKGLEIFRQNGDPVSIAVAKNLNEPLFFTFRKVKEPQVSCCKVDIVGWNQYNENEGLILGVEVEHYTGGTPENQYFREFRLRKYALDGVTLLPQFPGLGNFHWGAFKTDCYDDYIRFYGWFIPPSWLTIGKYKYEFSTGWDFPTYSVTCASDSQDILFGWPF